MTKTTEIMKKTITIIALAALFVSCAKEVEQTSAASGNVVTVAPTEFSATLETPEPDTKTTLGGDNGKTVLWESGDEIIVWPGIRLGRVKYTLSSGAGTNSATFTSDQTIIGDGTDRPNFALYPFDSFAELYPEGVIYTYLPETQNYRANSWDRVAMWMLAVTENSADNNLKFKNLSGVLSLSLKGTAIIDSIRVYALDEDERLAGWLYINTSDYSLEFLDDSSLSLILECESGVTLSETEGTVFNIVVPPITGGFRVDIYDREHGVMMLQSNSEIKRNTILKMPVVDYDPKAKDLGLSVYWATCNIGATTPEGYGDYFAWGETETKETYDWASYSMTLDGGTTFTKYNDTDGKTVLEAGDDAATQNWGSAWRMPTYDEMTELTNTSNCEWTWTTQNGVNGYKVASNKEGYEGASIFLPAAGYCDGGYLDRVGSLGCYWSSSLAYTSHAISLFSAFSGFNDVGKSNNNCYFGQPVRPVASKGIIISNTGGSE